MLIYKGFVGQIDYDNQANRLTGEVINSIDFLEFDGESANELRANFQRCIDEYLCFHKDYVGTTPTPFVANFTVCLSTDKQHQVINEARQQGQSVSHWLNSHVDSMLSGYFSQSV